MLSHLFVGSSHFGALTGAEIAGRDGGALGSSSELSLTVRAAEKEPARVGEVPGFGAARRPLPAFLSFTAARDAR